MHHPNRPARPKRTSILVRVLAGLALALTGVVLVPAAPALADDGTVGGALSGSTTLAHDGAFAGTPGGPGFFAEISVDATLHWTQPAAVNVHWDADKVRQGRNLDPSVAYTRTSPGSMSITYSLGGSAGYDFGGGVTIAPSISKSITTSGTCNLVAGGSSYTCNLASPDVDIVPTTVPAVPYFSINLANVVTVSPATLATLRTATLGDQPAGTNSLDLGEIAVIDPLQLACRAAAGDSLTYSLGDLSATDGLDISTGVGLDFGLTGPLLEKESVFSTIIPVTSQSTSVAMSGPGGAIDMGALKANNIAPTLGTVTGDNGVEGTAIQFGTSATGPCADGATYSWDWGDGTGHGHTATPQHTYTDNGTYTGQVVVTDTTGLTDTKDFTVHVTNANPNVTVLPGAPVTVAWGQPLTLKAQAVDPGAADQPTLTYAWTFGDGDSIDNGGPTATHSWSSVGPRSPSVLVCDKDNGCTPGNFTVNVRQRTTSLSYTGPQAGTWSVSSPLTASLHDEFGNPVNGQPVVFSVDGSSVGTATTNGQGVASLAYVVTKTAGSHNVSASYAGSPLYVGDTTGVQPFTVSAIATTLTYTGGLSGAPNKVVTVSGKVLDALGRPVPNAPVTFTIGTQSTSATTGSTGVATSTIKLVQKPGFYTLTAHWNGVTGTYLGDTATAQFSLNKK